MSKKKSANAQLEEEVIKYLYTPENRYEIELALIVSLLLENPEQDDEDVVERAMSTWEQMAIDRPVIESIRRRQATLSAALKLFTPEGGVRELRIEKDSTGIRLRQPGRRSGEQKILETRARSPELSGKFLKAMAERYREPPVVLGIITA